MEKLLIRNREYMKLPIDNFYAKWTDVPYWNAWDINMKCAWLNSGFTHNGKGQIMFSGFGKNQFEITSIAQGNGYSFKVKLLFMTLHFRRMVEQTITGICVVHEIRYSGLPIFNRRLLRRLIKNNRQSLTKLKCLLEEEHFRNKISYIHNPVTARAS